MELDYKWARVKFLNWSVKMSSNTGNIFVQLVAQHCCIASWKALLLLLPPSLPTCHATNFNVASCGYMSRKVGMSSTFCNKLSIYVLRHNLLYFTTLVTGQFSGTKSAGKMVSKRALDLGKFWPGTKRPLKTSAICGLWKFYGYSAFLANYMRKIMWLLINIHTVIAVQ